MNTKPYDQAFKFLAEQDPEALLLMLGAIEPGEQVTIELLPREISLPALLPDQPYLVRSAQGERVVHVEAWTRWEAGIADRMAEYGPLHWFKFRLPIDSYVILLTRKNLPRLLPQSGLIEAGGVRMETRFHLICLWLLSAQEALTAERPAVLPFVPLMEGEWPEFEAAAAKLLNIPEEWTRRETALHMAMLAGLRYNRVEVFELIERKSMIPLQQLRDSSVYQYIFTEGREEGREEGRRNTALHFFRRLAAKRFPGLALGAELEAIRDPEALERLACELDELADENALRQRLAALA